jgi:PAS domain S-box-containing protein
MSIQLNIHNRLALVLWGAALLAFIVAGAGVVLYQGFTLEHRTRQIMEPYAQLVSVGTGAAVAFEDPVRAQEILDTLRVNPQILDAVIYLDSGRILASFSRVPNATPVPLPTRTDGLYLNRDTAELLQALPGGGRLRLSIGLEQLGQQTQQALWIFGMGVLILLLVTFAQLLVLRRTIVRPIANLTRATELVRTSASYKHRVPASGTDEVAQLGKNFNAMMETIQQREDDLRQLTLFQRTILDTAAYGIISTTPEGTVTSFNPAAERLLGYTADEIVGKQTPVYWHDPEEISQYAQQLTDELGETIPPEFEVFAARLRRNLPEENEWTFVRKDGRRVPVNLSVTTLRDEEGNITGLVGMVYDLSEWKRAEQELVHYKDQLEVTVQERTEELRLARDAAEAANQAKSKFLANMSHELRTPLNAILGFSQLMRLDRSLSASQQETLDIINNSGDHLLKLINDVLEIAKIEAGKLQLEIATFDLHGMVREVSEMMKLRAQQKGLQLEFDQSSVFPRHIKADEARLRQILVNLVSNAVKFTEQGGVTIRLRSKHNARHHLLIEVEDTGPGISAADQQRLFLPFEQLSGESSRGGTGLGLTIVHQFIKLMGGSVSLESKPGKGSLFRVELPLQEVDEKEISRLVEQHHGTITGLAPGQSSHRILIAEDQRDNQLLLSKLMTDLGLEVKVAANGEQCIALFKQWQPDLIWMDWRMPVMDGEEATRQIRQLPGGDRVKIIAVTASALKEQEASLRAAGMDDYVSKPYRFDEVYDSLASQLGLKFLYRDDHPENDHHPSNLTPAILAGLDDELQTTLREAVASLDGNQIADIISRIAEIDPALARTLTNLADNYDYPTILQALDVATRMAVDR